MEMMVSWLKTWEKTRWVCKIESLKDGKKQARDVIKKV
jgi:hypothetical protein